MRGWVDGDGVMRSDQFFKSNENEKPQTVPPKKQIFIPLPPEENRMDDDSSDLFNVYTFTSRLDDLVFRDPNSGKDVYNLDLDGEIRFTLLAYQVYFRSRGERTKTVISAVLKGMPPTRLWQPEIMARKTSSGHRELDWHESDGEVTPDQDASDSIRKRDFFGKNRIIAFRQLPFSRKIAYGTMWAACVVMVVCIIIFVIERIVKRKRNTRTRSVSFRREETQMTQISCQENGSGITNDRPLLIAEKT
jgi:hypothetical protein